MNEKQEPLQMRPDMDLAEKLRKDFTAQHCVKETLRAIEDMCAAIGVTISWKIMSVDKDADVDQARLTNALGRMATASGSMLMGGKVNPISILSAQDPLKSFENTSGKRENNVT